MKYALFLALLFALIGCAHETRTDSGQVLEQDTTSEPSEVTAESRTLCGWFINPTPANAWIYDGEDEWTVGLQGGHQAEGDWPEFGDTNWVAKNGSYGYGCACMTGTADAATHQVIAIESAEARPLSVCRDDAKLADWESRQ